MSEQITMFGVPSEHPGPVHKSPLSRSLPGRYAGVKGMYAARPGTGPEGETCKTCKHKVKFGWPGKYWYKCALMKEAWTGSSNTDIRVKTPACSNWWLPDELEAVMYP